MEKKKRCIYNIVININIEKSAGHSLISKRSPHGLIRAGHPNSGPFPSLFEPEWHSHDGLQIRVSLAREAIRVEPRAHLTPWQFPRCASHALSTFYRLHPAAHRATNSIGTLLNHSTEWLFHGFLLSLSVCLDSCARSLLGVVSHVALIPRFCLSFELPIKLYVNNLLNIYVYIH